MDRGAESYRRFREEGDEQGLAEIIRDYQDGLILYLHTLVGNMALAEELAEDTFVRLGTKKPRNKGGSAFRTWLYTIGRHIAVDHWRRQSRRRETPLEEAVQQPGESAQPEQTYLQNEQRRQLYGALAALPPDYRQILWLVYFESFSLRAAASVMGKSPHAAEMLVCRARSALKKQLEQEGFVYENL